MATNIADPGLHVNKQAYIREGLAALGRFEARPALSLAEKKEVYRFRYEAYRSSGFIAANDTGECSDDLDSKPNTRAFALFEGGRIVSSIRFHLLSRESPWGPSMKSFADILEPRLERGETFVDPSRFTTDKAVAESVPHMMLQLMTLRIAVMACMHFDADYCLHLIRPRHGAFYRRFFGSQEWSEPRTYPDVLFPVQLYSGEFSVLKDRGLARMPFLNSNDAERGRLFDGMDGFAARDETIRVPA